MLIDALKLLHPYMPFITEEIFCTLQSEEESVMISKWPVYEEARNYAKDEKDIEILKEAVRGIRTVRTEMNVAPSKKAHVFVVSEKQEIRDTFEEGNCSLPRLPMRQMSRFRRTSKESLRMRFLW